MMIDKFTHQMATKCQVRKNDVIIVALSGGADSVLLLHLSLEAGYKCIAAHCNFSLRGEHSDGDENFVKEICASWGVPLVTEKFNTMSHAKSRKISVEMAAREIRYEWLNTIAENKGANVIATGHNLDDSIETFFLNLARGTGLKGLTGIASRKNNLVRPLLFATAKEIRDYCETNNLRFRVDQTNLETLYQRNKIRHMLVPIFNEINHGFSETMQHNMEYLREAWEVFEQEALEFKSQAVAGCDDTLLLPLKIARKHPQKKSMVFELLKPYGFPPKTIANIVKAMDGTPGKLFHAPGYRIVIDRYNMILTPWGGNSDPGTYTIEGGETSVSKPLKITLKVFAREPGFKLSNCKNIAHFDADRVDFPLTVRKAMPGDKFQPLGMENYKKISDFFVDLKFSIPEKERCWLMVSGEQIIWVIGHRIDNRYKVRDATRNILEMAMG